MAPKTEAELLDATLDLAVLQRWACHHDRPARRAGGRWHTAIQGHAGFPDLVLARAGLILFRELKGYDTRGRIGRLSSEQRDWRDQLGTEHVTLTPELVVPRFDVWTPDDWPRIITTLTARATVPR